MVIAPNPQNLLLRSASQKYSNAVVESRSKETQSTGMALGIAIRVQSTGGQAAQKPALNDSRAGRFPVAPLAAALSGRDQVQPTGGTWHAPCPCPPSDSGPLRHQGQRGDPDWEHGTAPLKRISPLEPAPPRQTQRSRALRPPGVPSLLKANLFCSRTFPSGTLPKLHDNRYLGNEARYMSE